MDTNQFILPQKINQDSDYRALGDDECVYKLNMRTGLTHGGNSPSNENFLGTDEVTNAYYEAGDVQIGSCADISNDTIIFFVYNSDVTKNKIVRYFPYENDRVDLILKNSVLNFKLDHKITSIDIVDDLLYWTDGYERTPFVDYNPPRKINMVKATATNYPYDHFVGYLKGQVVNYGGKAYRCIANITLPVLVAPSDDPTHWELANILVYSAMTFQILDRIKWPPAYAPGPSYDTDLNFLNNLLRNKLFQFSYRYVYDDNEKSVWSPISIVPLPTVPEYLNGAYNETVIVDNVINVWVNSGIAEVKEVDIAVREGNHGNWILIKRWYKYDQHGDLVTGMLNNINIVYLFHNNEVGEGLIQEDFNRPYDAVPQISAHEELIEKNRLSDEDHTEGFDNVDIDVSLTPVYDISTSISEMSSETFTDIKTLWTRADELGYIRFDAAVFDFNGFYEDNCLYYFTVDTRIGGVPSFAYNNNLDYYPYAIEYAHKGVVGFATVQATPGMSIETFINSIIVQLRGGNGTTECALAYCYGGNTSGGNQAFANFTGEVTNPNNPIYNWLTSPNQIGIIMTCPILGPNWPTYDHNKIKIIVTKLKNNKITTFSSGAVHNFGIAYYDRGNRCGAINTSIKSQTYVKMQGEYGGVHSIARNIINWEILHQPPIEADTWEWVYAKNTSYDYSLWAMMSEIGIDAGISSSYSQGLYFTINDLISNTLDDLPKFNVPIYVWEKGDRVRFIMNKNTDGSYSTIPYVLDFEIIGTRTPEVSTVYKMDFSNPPVPITDASGNKVIDNSQIRFLINAFPYNTFNIKPYNTAVQVYRPAKVSDVLEYYSFGQKFNVLNPHTSNRYHSATSSIPRNINLPVLPPYAWTRDQDSANSARGVFTIGDAYIYMRFLGYIFPCESLWFSDFFDSETISIGLPNLVNPNMRRQRFISNIRYSGLYIENTQVNDLSKVLGSQYDTLQQKHGSINSAQEIGDLLRVLQTNKCTSIYIGKTGFKQTPGQPDVVTVSESVIGTKYVHPEDYGTVFPESVVNSVNYTYFFDIYNACICRWSNNGVRQIVGKDSETGIDFGMKTYFANKSAALLESGIDNVNVYCTYEKKFENLIVTFVDSVNTENNETIMFHEPNNAWITFVSFVPDGYGSIGTVLTSSLNGVIYKHNSNSLRNNFYGVQYSSVLEIVSHGKMRQDGKYPVAIFNGLEMHTNSNGWSAPTTGDVSVKVDNTLMKSRIKQGNFIDREGVKIATFGKDMMTSGVEKVTDLYNGQDLRGEAIKIRLQNTDSTEVVVFGINVNMQISE